MTTSMPRATLTLTVLALLAFAGNSLLCRAALGTQAIDAASFTTVRIVSGACVLALLARAPARVRAHGSFGGGAALFAYALAFSCAYARIAAGVGALVLFGCVQVTMIGAGLARGERLGPREIAGLALACGGLAWLFVPSASSPDPVGALLMALAGVAWGVYSLLGRRSSDPVAATAGNFARAVPFALLSSLVALSQTQATPRGIVLAVVSGALTSGLGYVAWYAALRGSSASRAAIAQLAVPVLAGLGGVAILGESPNERLLVAAVLVLGGVALALSSAFTRSARR